MNIFFVSAIFWTVSFIIRCCLFSHFVMLIYILPLYVLFVFSVLVTIYAMVFPDSILRHFRTRLSRRKRSSSVDVLEDVSDSEERNKIAMEKRKRSSSLRSRRSLRRLRNGGKFEATNNITSPPERDYIVSQQIVSIFKSNSRVVSARINKKASGLHSSHPIKFYIPLSFTCTW